MWRGGEALKLAGCFDAVKTWHGNIHEYHVRVFVPRFGNTVIAIERGGNDGDAPLRIVVEDDAHRLTNHRVVIDDADGDRVLLFIHDCHLSCATEGRHRRGRCDGRQVHIGIVHVLFALVRRGLAILRHVTQHRSCVLHLMAVLLTTLLLDC